MPEFARAAASSSATTGPSAAGSSTGGPDGPRTQPSATASVWPDASNTRPVTPADSSDASHVTIGAIQRGERISRSSSVSGAGPRPSVMRVNATGATALTVTPYRPTSSAAIVVNAA